MKTYIHLNGLKNALDKAQYFFLIKTRKEISITSIFPQMVKSHMLQIHSHCHNEWRKINTYHLQ